MLRVFQAILSDKGFRKQEGAGEVIHLATRVTRNLFARLVPDTVNDGILLLAFLTTMKSWYTTPWLPNSTTMGTATPVVFWMLGGSRCCQSAVGIIVLINVFLMTAA